MFDFVIDNYKTSYWSSDLVLNVAQLWSWSSRDPGLIPISIRPRHRPRLGPRLRPKTKVQDLGSESFWDLLVPCIRTMSWYYNFFFLYFKNWLKGNIGYFHANCVDVHIWNTFFTRSTQSMVAGWYWSHFRLHDDCRNNKSYGKWQAAVWCYRWGGGRCRWRGCTVGTTIARVKNWLWGNINRFTVAEEQQFLEAPVCVVAMLLWMIVGVIYRSCIERSGKYSTICRKIEEIMKSMLPLRRVRFKLLHYLYF